MFNKYIQISKTLYGIVLCIALFVVFGAGNLYSAHAQEIVLIDYTVWRGMVDKDIQNAINRQILANSKIRALDSSFELTAFDISKDGNWGRAVVVPKYVFDAGFENLTDLSIIEFLLHKDNRGWNAFLFGTTGFNQIKNNTPSDFIDFSERSSVRALNEYRFPWTSGRSWWKNGGWHSGGWGLVSNAIDFQSQSSSDLAVLAASDGTLGTVCDRPDNPQQIWLKITNSDGTTGYGHLDKNSIDRSKLGQNIPRGTHIGNLYAPGYYYNEVCGYGSNRHLHFVFPTRDISMYDVSSGRYISANEMGNNTGTVSYTSNNTLNNPPPCNPNADQVALYVDANYSGTCVVKGVGNYPNPGSLGIANDSVSSIKVGGNVKLTLCRDDNYASTCETFQGDDSNLSDNGIGNDQVSSAKVETRNQPCNPNADQVALFADPNYGGSCVVKGIGNYANPSSMGISNDSLSSIKVGGNVKLTLCRDDNYAGTCEIFTGDDANLSDNGIGNDQASSAKVEPRDVPPPGNWNASFYDNHDRWWDNNNNGNLKCSENFSSSYLDKNYGTGAPCGGMDGDTWVGDYTGVINFSSGNYVFRVEHDDGLKMWLNGSNIADRGSSGADWVCPARSLSGNNTLRVMLKEDGGDAKVKVTWTTDTSVCNPPPTYTLSVSKAGTGSGTVTSNPGGINCGSDCSEVYANNTQVTLTATPTTGHTFAGWSGSCSGTGSCTVTMTSAKSVTATFNAPNNPILTVSKSGSGSGTVTSNPGGINCGTDCSESYTSGTVVTLTATPASESTFSGWSGGGCSGTGSCTVTMNSAQSVTATFTITTIIPTGWSIVSSTPNLTLWDVDILSENSARISGGWCCNPWISTIRQWNGLQWQDITHSGQYQLFTMDMVSDNEGWYGGQFGELLHYINGSFQRVNVTTLDIVEIDMISSQEGWAITSSGYPDNTSEILHFVNGAWQVYSNPGNVGLSALNMVSASDGWIGGIGKIYHYQNGNWVSVPSPTTRSIESIDMLSSTDGWAGTHDGMMLHYSNGAWSVHSTPGAGWGINGIDMLSETEGWAVGGYGLILHYINGEWTPVDNPATNAYLLDIDMISPSEGWAVGGFDGVVLRYYMPLHVSSIKRVNPNPTGAESVSFAVAFSEAVTGVDTGDFSILTTGVTAANISGVSGTGVNYIVTVNTGMGNGTIQLNLEDNDTILDLTGNPLGGVGAGNGDFTTGEVYAVNKTLKVTLTSTSAQDGWILESSENSNLGGTSNSTATTIRLGDDAARKQYRSILSFNTSSLPNTAVITKVTLKIRKQGIVGGGNPVTMFQGFMADIKRGIFGTSALQLTDWQAAASKTVGPFTPSLSGGWYTLNLTSAKAYINKLSTSGGLTQIRLRFKLDDNNNAIANYLSLYSGNAGTASRPQLIIEYYVP